jgi:hypothetical protein
MRASSAPSRCWVPVGVVVDSVVEVVAVVAIPVNVLVVGVDVVLVIGATSTAIAAKNLTCLPMSSAAVAVVNREPICEDGAHSHIWRRKRGEACQGTRAS